MTGHGAKFGRKKEETIVALLTQRNVEEAARAVDISTKTLLRWLKVPERRGGVLSGYKKGQVRQIWA